MSKHAVVLHSFSETPDVATVLMLQRSGRPAMVFSVSIWEKERTAPVVIVSEVPTNRGPSVTNVIEHIIKVLQSKFNCGTNAAYIEHYPEGGYDLVTLTNGQPAWKRISPSDVEGLILTKIHCTQEEAESNQC